MKVSFTLNKQQIQAEVEPGTTLLELLRRLGCASVKQGCDHGECGACTVLVDGRAFNACLLLAFQVEGRTVETVEGLSRPTELHPLQQAFLETGAVQCGFCTPGMLMALEGLVRAEPQPNETAVRDALAGNLCRCTGYVKPVQAALEFIKGKHEGDAGNR